MINLLCNDNKDANHQPNTMPQTETLAETAMEVYRGLEIRPRSISSSHFYDDRGSRLFQKIMAMPEYYLTNSEAEILEIHKQSIISGFCGGCPSVDLVELGAGDGVKTRILIQHMLHREIPFRYVPVDISGEALDNLAAQMRKSVGDFSMYPRQGDYFKMLEELSLEYHQPKIILFLGSNLGNMGYEAGIEFLRKLAGVMTVNDKLFIGLDLKKDPAVIGPAYNDPHGYTRAFNLNLLERFNRELDTDFVPDQFSHVPVYDPEYGAAKSYLVSRKDQVITFPSLDKQLKLDRWDAILTEISQKYDMTMIREMAEESGFRIVENYFDSRSYFVNSLWILNG